jgi:hypothetical protein
MLNEYHVVYSVRYYPWFHLTAVGLGTIINIDILALTATPTCNTGLFDHEPNAHKFYTFMKHTAPIILLFEKTSSYAILLLLLLLLVFYLSSQNIIRVNQ